MATVGIVPRGNDEGSVGTATKKWHEIHALLFNDSEISETAGAGKIPKAKAGGTLDHSWTGGEKAPLTHGHAIADITGLQAALDSASAARSISDITGLTDALAGKAATTHTHTYAVADITGLTDALAGKAASSHSHAISEITSLQATLDGKAYLSHEHDSTYLKLTGGTLTGVLTAQNNTSYTTKQTRNITMSTAAASGGGNGDVWLQYE